jgi:hypothetical protein
MPEVFKYKLHKLAIFKEQLPAKLVHCFLIIHLLMIFFAALAIGVSFNKSKTLLNSTIPLFDALSLTAEINTAVQRVTELWVHLQNHASPAIQAVLPLVLINFSNLPASTQ